MRGAVTARKFSATNTGFKFSPPAENGEVIATSEGCAGEDACTNGIESVRKNAPAGKDIQED